MRLAPLARTGLVLVACALVLVLARPARAAPPTPIETALLAAVNEARSALKLPRLRVGRRLQTGAHGYARTLMRRDLLAHARLSAGVGEALAWGVRSTMDPREIVRQWLESPAHRPILLSPTARRAGVGVSVGRFNGRAGIQLAVARVAA